MSSAISTQLLIAGLSMFLLGVGGLRTIWNKSRWLRERTGSLLMPILAHGAEDVFFFAPRML